MDDWRGLLEQGWAVALSLLDTSVLGLGVGRILAALGIILACLLLRSLFIRIVSFCLLAWMRQERHQIGGRAILALEQPIGLVPLAVGVFLAAEVLRLDGMAALLADRLVKTLVIASVFWGLYCLMEPFSFLLDRLRQLYSREMVSWLLNAFRIAFVLLGAAAILQSWNIQVAPLLAGLGIVGVAAALGAQDLFKNLIAGLLIIAERRFTEGDWIRVDGVVEGTVENIGFRSTHIRRFDKAPVQVPNGKLSDEAVTNFSRMTHRRIYWIIGVEYGTTVPQLRKIRDEIEGYVFNDDAFVKPTEASTFDRIDKFNDSSIDIMLYCFTVTTDWGTWLKVKEALAYKIIGIVEGAGSSFAFPSQSVYVESLPGTAPEAFIPPAGKPAGK